jgi:uncharacterized protein YjbI with pentapeptide repeats
MRTRRLAPVTVAAALVGSLLLVGTSAEAAHSCTPRARADLAGCDFSGDNLTGKNLTDSDLRSAEFQHANLTRARLNGADLDGATLTGANVTTARFAGADLDNVVSGALIGKAQSLPAHWLTKLGYLVGPDADLAGADLTGADLAGADLQGADLGAVVPPCHGTICAQYRGLTIARLTNTDLEGANLKDANLTAADLAGAELAGARLAGSNLSDVADTGPPYFAYPLEGDTNLAEVQSGSLEGTPAELPSGWEIVDGYLVGPGADLAGASLSGANLSTADLAPMEVSWPSSLLVPDGDLPTDFTQANDEVIGPGTNLSSSNLTDANLVDEVLSGANLADADLTGADVAGVVTDDTTTCQNGDAGPCTF